jgi:hypothetical protein
MRLAVALLVAVGCVEGDVSELGTSEQALACAVIEVVDEVDIPWTADSAARIAQDVVASPSAPPRPFLGPPPIGECSQATATGHVKIEVCRNGSATVEDIARCLQVLQDHSASGCDPSGVPLGGFDECTFCERLIENHEVTICDSSNVKTTFRYRDGQCRLQTKKTHTKGQGCLLLHGEGEIVPHPAPAHCTTVVDHTFTNETVGDVGNCPRCASCGAPGTET